ncbi:response regulator transcription factor [Ruminococcus sp. D55t1_190419_H1]|uniref:response regulator transcription factor n=1 Tax=Ruminococcus sp. D55t1_190419_H1 TaxID=2787130 RepID=UPI001897DB2D|nr:response regulator transcription factor [Ruminococcus sp. D55t1_190419_H1]
MQTILICDDNKAVHEGLSGYLKALHYHIYSTYDGESAITVLEREKIDLVILDVMLPGIFGTEVCRQIRKKCDIPVLILSAKGDEIDRIIGLELGADDYVTKPFSPREVAVRVRNMLRRAEKSQENQQLVCAELCIVIDAYEVFVREKLVDLTPRETEVLYYLAKNAGRVLTRNQIMNCVWGYDYCGDTRAVDNQIKRIRQKLPDDGVHFEIKAVYGVGYKFEFAL